MFTILRGIVVLCNEIFVGNEYSRQPQRGEGHGCAEQKLEIFGPLSHLRTTARMQEVEQRRRQLPSRLFLSSTGCLAEPRNFGHIQHENVRSTA
jgi:hypothetical protein